MCDSFLTIAITSIKMAVLCSHSACHAETARTWACLSSRHYLFSFRFLYAIIDSVSLLFFLSFASLDIAFIFSYPFGNKRDLIKRNSRASTPSRHNSNTCKGDNYKLCLPVLILICEKKTGRRLSFMYLRDAICKDGIIGASVPYIRIMGLCEGGKSWW